MTLDPQDMRGDNLRGDNLRGDDPFGAPSFAAEIGLICFWLAFGCIGAIAVAAAIAAAIRLMAFLFSGIVE